MTSSLFQIQIGMKYVWFDNLQSMDRKNELKYTTFRDCSKIVLFEYLLQNMMLIFGAKIQMSNLQVKSDIFKL